ncbi:pollen receptor-like kinase 2 [Nicotiana tabacum]|uniref:non-specific serine/threonine protein kinase n=1 Tax=Nicotiana tabacum TaxID=4097 RepID=A0A1S4CH32_TOBAC|nr:PREDICTED: pollen receptor-like kinase 2 [Nicotiana tabacum]
MPSLQRKPYYYFSFVAALCKGAHPQVCAPPLLVYAMSAAYRYSNHNRHHHPRHRLLLLAVLLAAAVVSASSGSSEAEILLRFSKSLSKNDAFSNWNPNVPPCDQKTDNNNWENVICENGFVFGLRLEDKGLSGTIDVDALKELANFRTISLINNNFEGPLPILSQLAGLKTAYFSNNKFSGQIDNSVFEGMHWLKKLHIANNQFTGKVPSILGQLPKLTELRLENNKFEGQLPDFNQERIMDMNFSNNSLVGPIPRGLSSLKPSSFEGNDLCDGPLSKCTSEPKIALWTIILVVIAVAAAIAAIIVVIVILRQRKQTPETEARSGAANNSPGGATHQKAPSADLDKMEQGQVVAPDRSPEGGKRPEQAQKLLFLKDDMEKFDLPDLLKASAEILGSGVFGSTYKAALSTGPVMVVKRFRQMNNVGKEDFHEHMRRLGRLSHKNLLPVVAFYYRKEEKLLVSEYVNNVSLAVHLHGNKSRGQPNLDWPARLKIVKGVAKGLLYLYSELPSLTAPHGHLKSSNVLLNESYEPLLTDYALLPVVNLEHAQEHMIAYKSPEFKHTGRITRKTDVWTLGVLILEILTGKFPSNFLQQGKGSDTDLATWVRSVVNEDPSNVEVFEKDMRGTKNSEAEMTKLLKIGLSCCELDMDKRFDMKEAMERIEEVKEREGDDDFYSSYASEADMRSSRGLSDDFSQVSLNI